MNTIVNMTRREIFDAMEQDGAQLTSNLKKFKDLNETTYTVAINTWLLLVEERCGSKPARVLKGVIRQRGLRFAIASCNTAANVLISGEGNYETFCNYLITEDEKDTLQVLRYLKRFTPLGCDILNDNAVRAFLSLNQKIKGIPARISLYGGYVQTYDPYGPKWLLDMIKSYVHDILGCYTRSSYNQSFTNGTVAEGTSILSEKLEILAQHEASFFDTPLYPIGMRNVVEDVPVKITPVPKNYKTSRVIAMTGAVNNWYLNGIRKDVENTFTKSELGKRIHLDDQSINQDMARLGSVYNVYATIDLSGASDSISDAFARYVLPPLLYQDISRYNSRFMSWKGKRIRRYIFQTSGNPTTFCVETAIFLAICQAATDTVCRFLHRSCLQPVSYGDDMIVDVDVYDTLVEWMEMLGFTINLDKSFSSLSDYRESCGCEYRLGIDVSTKYYPRKPISADAISIASLIELQHRMFTFESVEDYLSQVIHDLCRRNKIRMTSSPIGEDCADLWDYVPEFRYINPPFDHSRMESAPVKRELHQALKAKYESKELADSVRSLMDMYYYTCTLRDGHPLIDQGDDFASYLAKVNHWTKSVLDYSRHTSNPSMVWGPTTR